MESTMQRDSFSAQDLQFFLATLSGLAPDEARRAKILYLRNAISEYHAAQTRYQASGWIMLLFAIIPLFWPFLIAGRRTEKAQLRLMQDRVRNAWDVWKDDLRGERLDLSFLQEC